MTNPLGIYEKALPKDLSWKDRFRAVADAGFDFMELSVDESPERLARLSWTLAERLDFSRAAVNAGIRVPTMCLSGHRKFPLGSADPAVRAESLRIMESAILFAAWLLTTTLLATNFLLLHQIKDKINITSY